MKLFRFLPLGTLFLLLAQVVQGAQALPRLIDLGADRCIPCKMMAPILKEMETEYAGQLDVLFIDVWKDRDSGVIYGVTAIPTQVFFSADGRELFRHVGFYSKAEILAKWQELGVELKAPAPKAEEK